MDFRPHRYRSACGRLDLFAREYAGPTGSAAGDEAAPLLLLHGLTRNSADFEPLAAHLAGQYRLIVPDQRGRGLSQNDPDPANYRPDVYAQDMFALMADLGIERAAIVGTSMGGLMAMVMAAMQPDAIRAIVFNDIGPVLDPAGLARIGSYVGGGQPMPDFAAAANACAAINRDAFPDFTDADWHAFARRTVREREDGRFEFAYDPAIAAGFADIGDTPQPDLWPLWQTLGEKPVLVLRGALSDLLSADTVRTMERLHSGPFRKVEVPHRGHAPLLDEPDALAAIERFLKDYAR